MPEKRVVITGLGPVSSVGIGKQAFWQGIVNKRLNLVEEECHIDGELWGKYFIHKVKDFNIADFGIDKSRLNDIREWKEGEEIVDLNYLLACIKLALDDSKLKQENLKDCALVLAHENLGLMPFGYKVSASAYEILHNKDLTKLDFFDRLYKSFLKSGYDIQTFADLFHVARVFDIHNYSLFINNACASGLYAIEAASQMIKTGKAKAVIIASSDNPDIYKYLWFKEIGIYSKDGLSRPYCKDSNGLVFGDGGAAVVLEDLTFAKKRRAQIYAEYLGSGFDLEGWKITAPQIGSDSYQKAINGALKESGLKPKDIDFLCPHGVSSKPIDFYEAKAITDVFGENPQKPAISTFKPYVGHNLGSAALLETVIILLSLTNNLIPATLNYDNPDPKYNLTLTNKGLKIKLKTAMKVCCAFAGFNAASIFKKI